MEAKAGMRRQFSAKTFLGKYAMYLILISLIAVFGIIEPAFFTGRNFVNILTSESSRGLLALGVAFCIISRGIDLLARLGHGGFVRLCRVARAETHLLHADTARALSTSPRSPRGSRLWLAFWLARRSV